MKLLLRAGASEKTWPRLLRLLASPASIRFTQGKTPVPKGFLDKIIDTVEDTYEAPNRAFFVAVLYTVSKNKGALNEVYPYFPQLTGSELKTCREWVGTTPKLLYMECDPKYWTGSERRIANACREFLRLTYPPLNRLRK